MALNDDLERGNQLLSDRIGINEEVIDGLRDYTNVLQENLKLIQFQSQEKREITSVTREINKIAQQNYTTLEKELGTEKLLKKIGQDKEKLSKRILQLNQLSTKIQSEDKELQQQINNDIRSTVGETENLITQMDKLSKSTKEISSNLSVKSFSALKGIAKSIPGLSKFSEPFDKAAEASRKAAAENVLNQDSLKDATEASSNKIKDYNKLLEKGNTIKKEDIKSLGLEEEFLDKNNNLMGGGAAHQRLKKKLSQENSNQIDLQNTKLTKQNVFLAGIKNLAKGMFKGVLIASLLEADKAIGDMAKSMGVSYSQAATMRVELTKIGRSSFDVYVTTQNLQKSMMALNKEFGTATTFSGEMLVDFTQLSERAGYSVEALGKLSKLTMITGGDLSDNTAEILGQAAAYNVVNGVALNEKQIVEDVAKTSAATTLTLGKNPKLIASANISARALGTSLEKVENIASSLLNFETSIANELEAELMIGRELNLEVAREAALRGDVGKVAEEVAKQVGTSAQFGKMNVLQQEALAKAVGMTKEDLAQSLINQEALSKLGNKDKDVQTAYNRLKKEGLSDQEIANKLGNQSLADQLKSESVNARLLQIVQKLKEVFIGIAQPILQIISPIVDILAPALAGIAYLLTPIVVAFEGLGKMMTGSFDTLSGWEFVLGSIAGIMLVLKARQLLLNRYQVVSEGIQRRRNIAKGLELGLGGQILAMLGFQNAAIKFQLIQERAGIAIKGIALAIENSKLGSIIAQGFGIVKNIAKDTILLGIKVAQAAAALIGVSATTLGIGTVVALAAAAAGIAYLNSQTKSIGDGFFGADGKTQISTREGGLYEISQNDDVVVAPGAGEMMNKPQSRGTDNSQLIAEVRRMNATLNQILQKDTNIEIDGTILNKKVQQSLSPIG